MAKDENIDPAIIHEALNDTQSPKQKLLDTLAPVAQRWEMHRSGAEESGKSGNDSGIQERAGGDTAGLKEEVAALRDQVAELTKLMKGLVPE